MLTAEEIHEIETEAAHYPTREAVSIDALKIVQQHRGWVSDESLRDIAGHLGMSPTDLDSVATFYNLIFRKPVGRHVIMVCDSVSCWIMGCDRVREQIRARLGVELGETTPDNRFTLLPIVCLGCCDHAPAMMVDRDLHGDLDPQKIDAALEKYKMTATSEKPLTGRMRPDGSFLDVGAYEQAGGYQAIRKVLSSGMTAKAVTDQVKDADLRGRGGAGFSTGLKWSFVPLGKDAPNPTYLVVNADEMEPGSFKDRLLMERDPHQLIEGAIVAGFAIEADVAYIFLRGEYTLAAERLSRAIAEAYERHYLGKNILGSGYRLELHLHLSGGRYICGDETGLLNALEGKRANPRSKPPFPPVVGLFGKPTVVNNVETISCVPHIINNGAAWFHGLSRTKDGGTKLFGASGKVKRPGLWELPMGTTVREILEEHAGGMRDGVKFRGLLPGGASTDFIVEEHLDTPMDFTEMPKVGSRLGTGTMTVLDDQTCPVGMTWNLTHFFAQESCGFCTPCWSGLGWADRILRAMEDGRGQPGDLDKLSFQAKMWNPGNTFCALAPGAAEPLQSALKYFRDDFERHIREHRCPWT